MSLGYFIFRRSLLGLVAIFGVCILVFFFLHLIPGDPVDQLTGGEATPEQRAEIEECLFLHHSMPKQFVLFIGNIANGSLGQQCPNPEDKPTVMESIVEVFPYTLALAFGGMLVAIVLALPLGIIAAVRRGTLVDTAAAAVSLSGLAIPVMVMGPILIALFFIKLGWLPGPSEPDAPFALLLPSITIGTSLMAMLSRMVRSSLVDVMQDDYMRTARAKGLSERVVILKHGLRNALLPVITIVGMQFGALLSGAIITEDIFSRPGLGSLLLDGIRERNYPVVQGTVLVIACIYVLVNIVVDIAYGVADPRVRRG